jgi:hypothetical protein
MKRATEKQIRNMRRWREEDKKLVVETLSEKADGMQVERNVGNRRGRIY